MDPSMVRTSAAISGLLALLALACAPGASAATVSCGQTITQSTTVDNDLTCGDTNGLSVTGSGVTLDLGGHRIRSTSTSHFTGIDISGANATVRNGAILGFKGDGVHVHAPDAHLSRLGIVGPDDFGDIGVAVDNPFGNDRAWIDDGLVTKYGTGIVVNGADARVRRNGVAGNVTGIDVQGATHARVRGNWATYNSVGVRVSGACARPGDCIVAESTIVRANHLNRNTNWGAVVGFGVGPVEPSGTLLWDNGARHNGQDGIFVQSSSTTVLANRAFFNGDYGIEAIAGTQDGGHNRAANNGNPAQCLNIACTP
jgi:nitrous oxidase accessory protein NosD